MARTMASRSGVPGSGQFPNDACAMDCEEFGGREGGCEQHISPGEAGGCGLFVDGVDWVDVSVRLEAAGGGNDEVAGEGTV